MKRRPFLLILVIALFQLTPMTLSSAGQVDALPQVSVDSPPGASFVSKVEFAGDASSAAGIDRVRVSIRERHSELWLQPNGSFGPDEHRFDAALNAPGSAVVRWSWSTVLPAGSYHANVRVVDLASGRNALRPWLVFQVLADDVTPTVSVDLNRNDVIDGKTTLRGSATDNVGVTRVRVGIRDRITKKWLHPDGTFKTTFFRLWANISLQGGKSVTWNLPINLPAGSYSANVRSVDAAKNRTTILPWIKFDVRGTTQLPLLVAAGDVATCSRDGDEQTAALIEALIASRTARVALLGDGAYRDGTTAEYADCYDASWGAFKSTTRPAVGNHDYHTADATGYFGYFGAAAGDPDKGYYAYNLGGWRIIVLNSECDRIGGCDVGSPQHAWLAAELAANPRQCILSYGHRPRYTSGPHGDSRELKPLWELMYDAGVDVVLAGHSHNYQRFRKLDAGGERDAAGIRSFVVGTGGAELKDVVDRHPEALVVRERNHGVLELELRAATYGWRYVTVDGAELDAGTGSCK